MACYDRLCYLFIFGLSISLSGLTNNSTSKMSVAHKIRLSIYTLFDNLQGI